MRTSTLKQSALSILHCCRYCLLELVSARSGARPHAASRAGNSGGQRLGGYDQRVDWSCRRSYVAFWNCLGFCGTEIIWAFPMPTPNPQSPFKFTLWSRRGAHKSASTPGVSYTSTKK